MTGFAINPRFEGIVLNEKMNSSSSDVHVGEQNWVVEAMQTNRVATVEL